MPQDYHITADKKLAEIKKAAFSKRYHKPDYGAVITVFLANKLCYPLEDFSAESGSGPS